MPEGGFLQQKRRSPIGFGMVVAGHAAALAAVILIKGTIIVPEKNGPMTIYEVPTPPDPDPVPPPPDVREPLQQQAPTAIDQPIRIIDLPTRGPVFDDTNEPPLPPLPPGPEIVRDPPAPPLREPVRIAAVFDPRYADSLQPPYPASEQRAEREGQVRVRVTIGTDGRVKAIQRLSATSDAFWASTERHARARWRFRPATVDGRPVETTKDLTLYFRLEQA